MTARRGGLQAITLDEDDELIYVRRTDGSEASAGDARRHGDSLLREDVRAMGRLARGVRGIRLDQAMKWSAWTYRWPAPFAGGLYQRLRQADTCLNSVPRKGSKDLLPFAPQT